MVYLIHFFPVSDKVSMLLCYRKKGSFFKQSQDFECNEIVTDES